MQKFTPLVGEAVRVRRRRWRVADARGFDGCALVTLRAPSGPAAFEQRRVLSPFDVLERQSTSRRPRVVSGRRWGTALQSILAESGPADALRGARTARVEMMAYQLEPALAVVRGMGSRVLIADDVGLGKTIQAGHVIAELLRRGAAERVLLLVPAGLREQWIDELSSRFNLPFALLDMREIITRRAQLPPDVNPWSTAPLVVTSIDFAKRAEVLPAIQACRWDAVVVDEAHGAVAGDRHQAARSLCQSAGYVVLLTATPHNGDPEAFDSLCRIGALGDELLVFRRRRADVGMPSDRRVHQLRVGATALEQRMYRRLDVFAAAVRAEHGGGDAALALSILRKRACSSAYSLERTVRRRLAALDPEPRGAQLLLHFDDGRGEQDDDGDPSWTVPALADRGREAALLAQLAAAAADAQQGESKLERLARLLARIREPVIVFTEYRDTLLHAREAVAADAVVIHGGLSRQERRAATAAFASGAARVLMATDAAGEGLNLHQRCRVVINLELPWNPVRLEQRIGRVDRIGQTRRVHAFHLVAAEGGEESVRQRLTARITAARQHIRAADPLGGQPRQHDAPDRLRLDASAECARLVELRQRAGARASTAVDPHRVLIHFTRQSRIRQRLGSCVLVLTNTILADAAGRTVAASVNGWRVARALQNDARFVDWFLDRVQAATAGDWLASSRAVHAQFWETLRNRRRAVARLEQRDSQREVQSGLFDRRAEREMAAASQRRRDRAASAWRRVHAAEHAAALTLTASVTHILIP